MEIIEDKGIIGLGQTNENNKKFVYIGTDYEELRTYPFTFLKQLEYRDNTDIIIIFSNNSTYQINIPKGLLKNRIPLFQAKMLIDNNNKFDIDLLEIKYIYMEKILEYIIYDDISILFKGSIDQYKKLLVVADLLLIETRLNNKSIIAESFIKHRIIPMLKNEVIDEESMVEIFEYVIYIFNELLDGILTTSINKMYARAKKTYKNKHKLSEYVWLNTKKTEPKTNIPYYDDIKLYLKFMLTGNHNEIIIQKLVQTDYKIKQKLGMIKLVFIDYNVNNELKTTSSRSNSAEWNW